MAWTKLAVGIEETRDQIWGIYWKDSPWYLPMDWMHGWREMGTSRDTVLVRVTWWMVVLLLVIENITGDPGQVT